MPRAKGSERGISLSLIGPYPADRSSSATTRMSRKPPTYADATKTDALHFYPTDGKLPDKVLTEKTVTTDECIAHLKLLGALADLRDRISAQDGIFQLWDISAKDADGLDFLRKKRWGVYVSRAVDRFESWYDTCVGEADLGPGMPALKVSNGEVGFDPAMYQEPNPFTPSSMPPLDVLMVWHAYMLSPLLFLEDCIRLRRLWFWRAGFPWSVVNECISSGLDYITRSAKFFEKRTGRAWTNEKDQDYKVLKCPTCTGALHSPWTTTKGPQDGGFKDGVGYADSRFACQCPQCSFVVNREVLKVIKFRRDVRELFKRGTPLPGTVLPPGGTLKESEIPRQSYANDLLTTGTTLEQVLEATDLSKNPSIDTVRKLVEAIWWDGRTVGKLRSELKSTKSVALLQRVSLRRMMASYWDNCSPFGLELTGAVLRQGTFIQKMDDIDWLHSPALQPTVGRLINKYGYFMQIIAGNTGSMAVPTLDVDLAWHTHQLSALRYYAYCVKLTGQLINHDDKVDEGRLSDAFERTVKEYQELTGGDLYSACTCWYCEATRAAGKHQLKILGTSTPSTVRKNVKKLHELPEVKPVHISTHNSIVPVGANETGLKMREARLRAKFDKANRRLRKRGIIGEMQSSVPYASEWSKTDSDVYAHDPTCANFVPKAAGNCVNGMCSGRVSAGACVSGSCGGGTPGGPFAGCGGMVSPTAVEYTDYNMNLMKPRHAANVVSWV